MSKTTTFALAPLLITLLISCGVDDQVVDIPPEILAVPDLLALPVATNHARAQYILASDEWMEGARIQVATLAGVVCLAVTLPKKLQGACVGLTVAP